MNLQKSGGPMRPTISGKRIDETTFQFEGMTLFDYFVGQFILVGSESPVENAFEVMEKRNKHLMGEQDA
tara:strand:- start:253 stop:459 length:207 start_codon:yes stop_codon:yes gene_type:complete